MNWPRKGWGVLSWGIQVWNVTYRAPFFGFPDLVTLWGLDYSVSVEGNSIFLHFGVNLYSDDLGSLLWHQLQWGENAIWSSVAWPVSRVPSLRRFLSDAVSVGGAGMISILSWQ